MSDDASYPPGGIVQVWPMAFVGGAERAMLSVVKATPDLPWRGVAITGPGSDPAMVAAVRAETPVATDRAGASAMLAGADVVLAWWNLDLRDFLPATCPRPKVVLVSHSPAESLPAVRLMADDRGVDAYVAVSRAALGPIPARRRAGAVVIPNAIDADRLAVTESRDSVRASWGLPPGAKVLGGLNRLGPEKRTRNLIDALALLPPEWHAVVVGEGRERAALERHAARRAPGRVVLPGARLDVGNVLDAFDRLVVASEYESFCLSMAEALMVGVPVISTPVGIALEHPELVRPLPSHADGPSIAAACLADPIDPTPGMDAARRLWSHEAMGRAWGEFLRPMLHDPSNLNIQVATPE